MEKTNFESLDIYALSEKVADKIWNIASKWPILAQRTVGEQVIRSADSIGANIAEGSGRGTPTDNRRFLRMARGSLYETRHWLRRALKRDLLDKEQTDELSSLIAELTPKLNAYIRKVNESVGKGKID
jgi:four helix bundle protein